MQKPIYFENEIVQPSNLEFLNDSMEKNIKDVVTVLTGKEPGIASGLTLSAVIGNNFFTVAYGYGFLGNGERVELFSSPPNNPNIEYIGTQGVYLGLHQVVYNPEDLTTTTSIDPTDNSSKDVRNYNVGYIAITPGVNNVAPGVDFIKLGNVTADASKRFLNYDTSGTQYLSVAGIINLYNNTIDGSNIGAGTLDSNVFVNPLTYDINLGTDVDILNIGSGNNNLGSESNPMANIYAVTGNFHELTGFSPILIDTLSQKAGTSLEAIGNSLVQIDKNKLGTQFGGALTLNSDSISTFGTDKDINITAAALKTINLISKVNVNSDLYANGDLYVGGTAHLGSTNISSAAGNFNVTGALSYGSSNELTDNLIRNSNFAIPSGNITGTITYPANWKTTVLSTGLGNYFTGTVAGTGTESSLSPTSDSVYFGIPNTTNWLLCSGAKIDSSGAIISQLLPELKQNTTYNLSFFEKGINNFSGLAIDASISGTTMWGTPLITSITQSPNFISSYNWAKQTYQFTNTSGNNFNLNLRAYAPTGLSTGFATKGVFGITAAQITEGAAVIPYNKKEKIQQININTATDFSVSVPVTTIYNQSIPYYSTTFYTKGGLASINANLSIIIIRASASAGNNIDYALYMTLDGKKIAEAINLVPYGMANSIPGGYRLTGRGDMNYSTYLEPGYHTLTTSLRTNNNSGWLIYGNWQYWIYPWPLSNISITIAE